MLAFFPDFLAHPHNLSFGKISLRFERNFESFSSFLRKTLTGSKIFWTFWVDFGKFCLSFGQISLSLVKILSFLRLEFWQKSQEKSLNAHSLLVFETDEWAHRLFGLGPFFVNFPAIQCVARPA